MTRPELSVVIVSYRCAAHLERCLGSLQANASHVRMQVIVVDNASDDHTLAVARSRPGAEVIANAANLGFARAANQGMARARGTAVLVLNPDTVIPAGALRACLDALWAHPRIGVLTPRIVDTRGVLDARCHRSFPTAVSAACFAAGLDTRLPWRATQAYAMRYLPEHDEADVDAVSGAFMLMRTEALRQVGGFDQQFFMYAEDIDLCMRMNAAGWRVVYWPGAWVTHVGGGSSQRGVPRRAHAAAFRTMAPLIRKHRPGVRGAMLATAAAVGGELMLAASRLRPRAYS